MTQLGTQPTVLIVEDAHFFCITSKIFVEAAGYQVCTAMDGLEALQVLEKYLPIRHTKVPKLNFQGA